MTDVDAFLTEEWLALRNGAGPVSVARVHGAIDALHAAGLLSDEIAELWELRISTCPGHDDEGGRSWCAYCGTMRSEPEEPPRGGIVYERTTHPRTDEKER